MTTAGVTAVRLPGGIENCDEAGIATGRLLSICRHQLAGAVAMRFIQLHAMPPLDSPDVSLSTSISAQQLPQFTSRPPARRLFQLTYDTASTQQPAQAAYHGALVTAELLLRRLQFARARGIRAVNLQLGSRQQGLALARPPAATLAAHSAERLRWIDEHGRHRAQPLNRERLTDALIAARGLSLLHAVGVATCESHAISDDDQAWLALRARLPLLQRPLNASEYRQLARALDAAHAVPAALASACQGNAAVALQAAAWLGTLPVDFTPSPFRSAALTAAYLGAHHDRLSRRAAFAEATELRLRFSHAAPRAKMDAKLVRQRTEHAQRMASIAMTATLSASTQSITAAGAGETRSVSGLQPLSDVARWVVTRPGPVSKDCGLLLQMLPV